MGIIGEWISRLDPMYRAMQTADLISAIQANPELAQVPDIARQIPQVPWEVSGLADIYRKGLGPGEIRDVGPEMVPMTITPNIERSQQAIASMYGPEAFTAGSALQIDPKTGAFHFTAAKPETETYMPTELGSGPQGPGAYAFNKAKGTLGSRLGGAPPKEFAPSYDVRVETIEDPKNPGNYIKAAVSYQNGRLMGTQILGGAQPPAGESLTPDKIDQNLREWTGTMKSLQMGNFDNPLALAAMAINPQAFGTQQQPNLDALKQHAQRQIDFWSSKWNEYQEKEYKARGGKPITPEVAKQFLQQANGDKNKARQLARQAGYSF